MFLSKMSPLGSPLGRYRINQILCNISNGKTAKVTFYPGIYYIRAQGAGGGGGNGNYWSNGGGGGSGAGFEGYIRVSQEFSSTVTTGVGGANSSAGADTVISGVMTLGGGKGGASGEAGAGGIYDLDKSGNSSVTKSIILSNGNAGLFSNAGSPDDRCRGGMSVLTGDGAGTGGSKESVKATKPGAGGGGQIQWGAAGGTGSYGECLIKFISLY